MDITMRGLWTLVHGMGFGALYLLACSGALIELWRRYSPITEHPVSNADERFLSIYLTAMAVLAWVTVLTGTYLVYPWYRATPPAGTANLGDFPQRLLLANPDTREWHFVGMEWKEHVAWLVPIAITMAAVVFLQYGRDLRQHPQIRKAVLTFTAISLVAAGIAGFFGAMLVKAAPVGGGGIIHVMRGGEQ
jgi:hypothetical protein